MKTLGNAVGDNSGGFLTLLGVLATSWAKWKAGNPWKESLCDRIPLMAMDIFSQNLCYNVIAHLAVEFEHNSLSDRRVMYYCLMCMNGR